MTTINIYVRNDDGAEKLVGTAKAAPGMFELRR